ncbi:ParA family protein [Crocosphaera sp. UHCC 0190]|uniref:KGGVGR-motif variant AAA ATPase n=1 Tax=Crocosphaera sp. UHCC 0190 TaxID=3110246 RepID=UPI002B212B03|nr:ParA family protein [Crocosphaera sp. UHCC 0190]MEA5509571.1 ParA family protein [Crocosphaera sp. UHCC 0190]
MRLLTWLDVKRIIAQETNYGNDLPDGIIRISCFSDALEISLTQKNDKNSVSNVLKEWFGDWYQQDQEIIQLDFGDAHLPIEFIFDEQRSTINLSIRPFWEEVAYINNSNQLNTFLPEPHVDKPNLIAFYSFKGGVGRTLHLAAYVFALLDRAKQLNTAVNILVIDADLEAPGLTYWNNYQKVQPKISFVDFLEVYHYSPNSVENSLELLATEIKKSAQNEGKSTLYFLPAFYEEKQLLDTPILPENLVRNLGGTWECGDAIYNLGRAVGVDYIFIDLRAGLSEISSPLLFDPRIQRFLVTTLNEQSINGTKLVLEQLGHIAYPETEVNNDNEKYFDPSVIISWLTPEVKSLPAFDESITKLQSAYIQSEDENLYSTRLEIQETYFAQELLYINNWEEARNKLQPTSVMDIAKIWSEEQSLTPIEEQPITPIKISSKSKQNIDSEKLEEVRTLREICQQYEYAEQGKSEELLVTEPLKNLAINFQDNLPHIVSIGSKGAGKTFNYIQLSRSKFWEKFLNKIERTNSQIKQETYIFPLLESRNLSDQAKKITREAREQVRNALGDNSSEFLLSECSDRIKTHLNSDSLSEPEWTEIWISEIAKSFGIEIREESKITLSELNQHLKNKFLKIIVIFDGLEDIFPNIAKDKKEQYALKALIDDLPNKLAEIRQANLGIIIFLRRDFLRNTISQNVNQFEKLYSPYDLTWDQDSFLKLAFWLCSQAKIIEAKTDEIEKLSREELKEKLKRLWGNKLGTDKSKDAYSPSWIFAALTDFNGRLQARDIVRFLYYAADITIEKASEVQFERWSNSRLLPPQAIRRALKPCSEKKVEEAKQEYPAFKTWVEETLPKYPPADKKIPFDVNQFNLDIPTKNILEEMGVIYEDKEKDQLERFYMPEIFREGLGFSGKGARPRVIALKRKVLGQTFKD